MLTQLHLRGVFLESGSLRGVVLSLYRAGTPSSLPRVFVTVRQPRVHGLLEAGALLGQFVNGLVLDGHGPLEVANEAGFHLLQVLQAALMLLLFSGVCYCLLVMHSLN